MKKITSNTNVSLAGQVMMIVFMVAGLGIVVYGIMQFLSGSTGQGILGLGLGGVFLVVGWFTLKSQMDQKHRIAFLNQQGVWIKAKVCEAKTVTTDSVGRCMSLKLILEANSDDQNKYGLSGHQFESEQIYARSLPDNYQTFEFDVVFDPKRPTENYFVDVDMGRLFKN